MKRLCYVFLLFSFMALHCVADEYIIKAMNGQSIPIGTERRVCRVGSKFKSNEKIYWSDSKVTIIEAQNIENMTICYFVPTGTPNKDNRQSSNILQRLLNYFTSVNYLSTRESDKYEIDEALTKEHILADTIRIKTDDSDDSKKYYASFYHNGNKHIIPLIVENGDIIFERSKFIVDGITLPHKFILTIYYKKEKYYHEITKGMSLTVI